MNRTAKRQYSKNNTTQKNRKPKLSKNYCKYKSCKSKLYKSIYGGRHTSQLFF